MEIIDTHMHDNNKCNVDPYRNKKIDEYLDSISYTNIDFFIPSINPKVQIFTCPNDCSNLCEILGENYVCPTNCQNRKRHRIKILDSLNGELLAYCTECKEIIYEGKDPFREYNLELIEKCKKLNNAIPNLVLTLSNSTINSEVNFYEKNFPKDFCGYKIHQTTNMRSINDITYIDSTRPILVHCDAHKYDSYDNVIVFAKRYDGNIVLAHSYLIKNEELLKNMENIYFDVCPTDNFNNYRNDIKHNNVYDQISNVYEAAIKYLPEDRIVFGTDWPYGNVESNIDEISKANIDINIKQKILSKNARKLYKL